MYYTIDMDFEKSCIIAFVYDFDGTLIPGNMQEQHFLPSLGFSDPKIFWDKVAKTSQELHMDQNLCYLYLLKNHASIKGNPLTRAWLQSLGEQLANYYPGLTGTKNNWFNRINSFAANLNNPFPCKLEHYIISSGHQEMIERTPIAKHMSAIFASQYAYDKKTDEALWPARQVNLTIKTQYLFRISKGAIDLNSDEDEKELNRKFSEKEYRIPFRQVIYIGDSAFDVPSFSVVTKNNGYAIAVHDPQKKPNSVPESLATRVARYLPADYREDKPIERYCKNILKSMYHNFVVEHHR